ncbi:DUF4258 domain-containing protein [Candidatus Woesearchaeota archaeon]|nr:DUF4258 domain-containing protein [Candidatus Woesearchaeota archaeon]
MRYAYTKHAIRQIIKRGIHKIWIIETIKYPNEMAREDHKFYAIKQLNGKTLKVVYTRKKYIKIITTYFIK